MLRPDPPRGLLQKHETHLNVFLERSDGLACRPMRLSSWLRGAPELLSALVLALLPAVLPACSGAGTPSSGAEPTVTVTAAAPPLQEKAPTDPAPAVKWNVTYDAGPHPAGWSKSGPQGDLLLRLSGPPGGPLGFEVTRAPALPDAAALAAWIKADFKKTMNRDVDVGPPGKVALGGADVMAYSFTSGESLARTAYCVALYPVGNPAAGSVVVIADVSAGPTQPASCAKVTADPSIAPVWTSLKVTPE